MPIQNKIIVATISLAILLALIMVYWLVADNPNESPSTKNSISAQEFAAECKRLNINRARLSIDGEPQIALDSAHTEKLIRELHSLMQAETSSENNGQYPGAYDTIIELTNSEDPASRIVIWAWWRLGFFRFNNHFIFAGKQGTAKLNELIEALKESSH